MKKFLPMVFLNLPLMSFGAKLSFQNNGVSLRDTYLHENSIQQQIDNKIEKYVRKDRIERIIEKSKLKTVKEDNNFEIEELFTCKSEGFLEESSLSSDDLEEEAEAEEELSSNDFQYDSLDDFDNFNFHDFDDSKFQSKKRNHDLLYYIWEQVEKKEGLYVINHLDDDDMEAKDNKEKLKIKLRIPFNNIQDETILDLNKGNIDTIDTIETIETIENIEENPYENDNFSEFTLRELTHYFSTEDNFFPQGLHGEIIDFLFDNSKLSFNFKEISKKVFFDIFPESTIEKEKVKDIFHVLYYIFYKIQQYENETLISLKYEMRIKEINAQHLSSYRKQNIQENEIGDIVTGFFAAPAKIFFKEKIKAILENTLYSYEGHFFYEKNKDLFLNTYETAYHEAGHCYVAWTLKANPYFLVCANDFFSDGFSCSIDVNNWSEMIICAAGVLGEYFASHEINSHSASSDFASIIDLAKDLFQNIQNNKNQYTEEEIQKIIAYKNEKSKEFEKLEKLGISFDDFVTNEFREKFSLFNAESQRIIKNLICGCIIESWKILAKREEIFSKDGDLSLKPKKIFQKLAEILAEQKVMTYGEINKCLTSKEKTLEFLKNFTPIEDGASLEEFNKNNPSIKSYKEEIEYFQKPYYRLIDNIHILPLEPRISPMKRILKKRKNIKEENTEEKEFLKKIQEIIGKNSSDSSLITDEILGIFQK